MDVQQPAGRSQESRLLATIQQLLHILLLYTSGELLSIAILSSSAILLCVTLVEILLEIAKVFCLVLLAAASLYYLLDQSILPAPAPVPAPLPAPLSASVGGNKSQSAVDVSHEEPTATAEAITQTDSLSLSDAATETESSSFAVDPDRFSGTVHRRHRRHHEATTTEDLPIVNGSEPTMLPNGVIE